VGNRLKQVVSGSRGGKLRGKAGVVNPKIEDYTKAGRASGTSTLLTQKEHKIKKTK